MALTVSCLKKICMINLWITFQITGQWQPQLPIVEVVPDNNNVSFSANILSQTMEYFALMPLQHANCCYVHILCLHLNTPYTRWHMLLILPFCKQGLSTTLSRRKQTRTSKIFFSTFADALLWRHHRSMTPKSVTPTAPSCIDNNWRSTTLTAADSASSNQTFPFGNEHQWVSEKIRYLERSLPKIF